MKTKNKINVAIVICLLSWDSLAVKAQDNVLWAIEPKYERVDSFSESLAGALMDNKWGFIDKKGNWVVPPQFDEVGHFNEGFASVSLDDKWGIIDKEGKWIIEPQFDNVHKFSEGLAAVSLNGKWGYIDKKGKIVIDLIYYAVWDFKNESAIIKLPTHPDWNDYGLIDKQGSMLIEPSYGNPSEAVRGYSLLLNPIRKDNKFIGGLINKAGEWITKREIYDSKFYSDGLAMARDTTSGKWGFINKAGEWMIRPTFQWVHDFENGVARAVERGKYGLIDKLGNWIMKPRFDYIYSFDGNFATVVETIKGEKYYKRKEGLIDIYGNVLFAPKFDHIKDFTPSKVLLLVFEYEPWLGTRFIDKKGNYAFKQTFDRAWNFSEDLALVSGRIMIDREITNFKSGFINTSGDWAIRPSQLDSMNVYSSFSGGLATVEYKGKYGFIGTSGDWVIPAQFEAAGIFSEDLAWVKMEGKYGFINKVGKIVVNTKFEETKDFTEGVAPAKFEGKWGLINKFGAWIINPQFYAVDGFTNGISIATDVAGGDGLIDKLGKWIIPPEYSISKTLDGYQVSAKFEPINYSRYNPFDDSRNLDIVEAWDSNGNKYGFIDYLTGDWIIEPIYDYAKSFIDGMATVEYNGRWGFIDKQGEWITDPIYDEIEEFINEIAAVKYNGKWGFIDKQGRYIVDPIFESSLPPIYSHDLIIVRKNNKYYFYDQSGYFIENKIFSYISMKKELLLASKDGKTYGLIDKQGNWIMNEGLLSVMLDSGFSENLLPFQSSDGKWGYIICRSSDYIKYHVETQLASWQQKSEFESIAESQQRVNHRTREAKIKELFDQAVEYVQTTPIFKNEIKQAEIKGLYDSENRTFLVSSPAFGQIVLKVGNGEEARYLKENWDSVQFSDANFIAVKDRDSNEEKIVLSQLTATLPSTSKSYAWDIRDNYAYEKIKVQSNFDIINLAQVIGGTIAPDLPYIVEREVVLGASDVDIKIPTTNKKNTQTYALIIGNEDYSQATHNPSSNVPFAENDAKVFKDYCVKTLGIPDAQVKLIANATGYNMLGGIDWLVNKAELNGNKTELVFYYAGHGLPDEESKEAFLIPTDLDGTRLDRAIGVNYLYAQLNTYPTAKTTVFLDACFSGGARNESLMQGRRAIGIQPKSGVPQGNTVAFTSSSNDESSGVYKEKQHGYFTYFLLKALQETKGNISYNDLYKYLYDNVRKASDDEKRQTPSVISSMGVQEDWKKWRFNE